MALIEHAVDTVKMISTAVLSYIAQQGWTLAIQYNLLGAQFN